MSVASPSTAMARLASSRRASILFSTFSTTTKSANAHASSPSTPFTIHFRQALQRRPLSQTARLRAGPSSKKSGGSKDGLVLEKPDKFRPPSHPARLRSNNARPVRQYGPETTAAERDAMARKAYPNMMPPEGSLMHWLLTSRGLHLWITISILSAVGIWTFVLHVKQSSPFADMLPSRSQLMWHPLDSIYQAVQVLKMSTEHTSKLTAEKRARELDEVRKRKAYRLAHGLEGMDGIDEADPVFAAALASRLERESRERGEQGGEEAEEAVNMEVEAEKRARPVKKWLGIW